MLHLIKSIISSSVEKFIFEKQLTYNKSASYCRRWRHSYEEKQRQACSDRNWTHIKANN